MAGVIYLQAPGVTALAFGHLLRAVFCWREDLPGPLRSVPPVPGGLIDGQSVLAGHFAGRRIPAELVGDRRSLRVTAVGEPWRVQCAVYAHLVRVQPELVERRSGVFGSLECFLRTRENALTGSLAAALGVRRVAVEDFDSVVVEEAMEDSLRGFLRVGLEWANQEDAPERVRVLLSEAAGFAGSLGREFGGDLATTGGDGLGADREFRERNRSDYAFYESALERARAGQVRRRRGRMAWPRRMKLVAGRGPVFVFNHLPKSYGTSLRRFFGMVFGGVEDHTEFLGRPGAVDDAPVELGRLTADTLLCGHFTHGGFLLQRRYPAVWADAGRFRLFTFVREPLATAVSNYRHVVARDPAAVAREPELYRTLEGYLGALENPIAQRLGADGENFEAVLERYFFVGAAEDHVAGLPVLLGRMRGILEDAKRSAPVERALAAVDWLSGQTLEHTNAAARQPGDGALPAEVVQAFRERNAVDYKIYERAGRH